MQVMALRGAKDSGLHVPDKMMTDSIKYINKCHDSRTGGYRYQPYSSGPGFARTAAGVCVLQLCGEYEADEIKKAVEFMERVGDDRGHYWYGHYYAAHALNQVGGEVWEKYYKQMRDTPAGPGYQQPKRRVVRLAPRSRLRPRLPDLHRRAHPQRPDPLPADLPEVRDVPARDAVNPPRRPRSDDRSYPRIDRHRRLLTRRKTMGASPQEASRSVAGSGDSEIGGFGPTQTCTVAGPAEYRLSLQIV